jgi:hypothetical protein
MIGYVALTLNLVSMSMSNLLYLRVLSLIANAIYIGYAVLLDAPPLVVGCSIAVVIHSYGIFRIYTAPVSSEKGS